MVSLAVDEARSDIAFGSWTGHARYTPNYGNRQSTSEMWGLELAPTTSLSAAVESVGGRERERFSLAGGEVAIYDCAEPQDARWAAWLGPWHMVHGMFYAPQWDVGDIVETFSRVAFTDTADGMTADPGRRWTLERSIYLLAVAGVGTLFVEEKQAAAKQIPRWRGLSVAGGEVWRLPTPPNSDAEPLLLVTGSALATLSPWDAPNPAGARASSRAGAGTTAGALEFLSNLTQLEWAA